MNKFDVKDFEQLMFDKIRNGLDPSNPISSYFFCDGDKILFISKFRNFYKIMGSCTCSFTHYPVLYHQSCFECFYFDYDFMKVKHIFFKMIKEIIH